MADEQLFEDLPEQQRPQAEGRGAARLREPERSQMSMQVAAVGRSGTGGSSGACGMVVRRGARSVGIVRRHQGAGVQPGHPQPRRS